MDIFRVKKVKTLSILKKQKQRRRQVLFSQWSDIRIGQIYGKD